MSHQPPQQPSWLWSTSRQQWYYHDQRNDQYVLANGERIPRSMNVATHPPLQDYRPTPSSSNTDPPSYGSYTTNAPHGRQRSSNELAGVSSLNTQFRGLQIRSATQNRVTTNQRRDASGLITDTIDNVTGVRSISQTEPKEAITDANLLREGGLAHRMLRPTPNEQETLDPRFKVRKQPTKFFRTGRVFLTLWAEPAGVTGQSITSSPTVVSDMSFTLGAMGQYVHQKVRRFVVVREGQLFCTALPILTYGGCGVSRHKVKKSDHAIIYSGKSAPELKEDEKPKRGENGMRPYSIRVVPDESEDKLDPLSRIDFGKPHTIHHNLKVRPFGMVSETSEPHLLNQFKAVFLEGDTTRRQPSVRARPSMSTGNAQASAAGTTVRDYAQPRTMFQNSQVQPDRQRPEDEGDSSNNEDDTSEED